ncbi:MAG: DUF3106 domain-containing protein [Bdellovibrionaceae bacterium]|nr:DUF3106 domain-containing protein [Pseudobdellovibrionaceae bacterium]
MINWLLMFGLTLSALPVVAAESSDLEAARVEWRTFRSLSKVDQRRIHKVYVDFEKLTPALQAETRDWAKRWLELAPEEKAMVRHRLQRWERMSDDEKQALRDRWRDRAEQGTGT